MREGKGEKKVWKKRRNHIAMWCCEASGREGSSSGTFAMERPPEAFEGGPRDKVSCR